MARYAKPSPRPKRKDELQRIPAERLAMVESLLARCWSHTRIAEALAKEWKLTPDTIRGYIKRVYEALRVDDVEHRATRRDRLRSAYEDLYDRCLKEGDHAAARSALRDLGQLDGCFVERVEVSGPAGGPVEVDVGRAARELARKIAGLPPEVPPDPKPGG